MRLIDADAFKCYMCRSYESVKHVYDDGGEWAKEVTAAICKDIDEQPTIDAVTRETILSARFHHLPYTHITPTDAVTESYKRGWNDALDAVADNAPPAEAEQVTGKLQQPCDSLLTDVLKECKKKKSKLEPADAVEVVRCKDCKHRRPVMHTRYGSCIFSACLVKSDGYCSHGEVETEEVQQTLL